MNTFVQGAVSVLCVLSFLTGCVRVSETQEDSKTRMGQVHLFTPDSDARAVVFLFSDAVGWNEQSQLNAKAISKEGVIVVGVDLAKYLKNLRESDDGCHYLISEIEEYSKEIQRKFNFVHYHTPWLAGIGEGGTLSYAALSQSPNVTIAGALALNPVEVLSTKVALCPGATATAVKNGQGFEYAQADSLPGVWQFSSDIKSSDPIVWAPDNKSHNFKKWKLWLYGPPLALMIKEHLSSVNDDPAGLNDLPLTALPSQAEGDTLAIILSGDGGWRDIDRAIGEQLSKSGIAVVGLDTLRYFWQEKTPEQVAKDLTRMIDGYTTLWHRQRVLLIGYSFGADVLPSVYNILPPEEKNKIGQLSLLALSETADFQFHVEGWLGMESDSTIKTLPEIAKINPKLIQCVYGDGDDEVCSKHAFDKARRVKLDGGHHFDGDYETLTNAIIAQWHKQDSEK